ncbi:MAG TPA: YihY/virulence factor BrkB family protein [Streptosporangiaceae bacterium]|jgi:membrane protein
MSTAADAREREPGDGEQPRRPPRPPLHTRARARTRVLASGTWRLGKHTALSAFRYRVTGLSAEAAFFALLSLPPLMLGIIGLVGYFRPLLGQHTITQIRAFVMDTAHTVLTGSVVDAVVVPLLEGILRGGRTDIVSISFLISLWSGSRALNVYVDTITIAYGLNGLRGIVRTRALSFTLYVLGLVGGIVVIPLLIMGPTLIRDWLPVSPLVVHIFYWPVLVVLCVLFLTGLYGASVPVRTPWWRNLPGAFLALVIWIIGSAALRLYLGVSLSGVSIYGSLAAPIAVLAWLYVTAFAVLIGALLNASIDQLWPIAATREARKAREQATQPMRIGATRWRSRHDEPRSG